MGYNELCSWDEGKRESNLSKHGYDFIDIYDVFDGRFSIIQCDTRQDYKEERYNMLVLFESRIINITFTPRLGKYHLISVRPASREERYVYFERRKHDGTL